MYKEDLNIFRIKFLIDKYSMDILNDPNIIGVGRGLKTINGNMTNIPSLTFLVKNKVSKSALPSNKIIPSSIRGSITDVLEGDIPTLCKNESRPAYSGLSIGPYDSPLSGTITYPVTDKATKKNLLLLTCCHVVDKNLQPQLMKTRIIQPCKAEGGDGSSVIGIVTNYNRIITEGNTFNEIDAATVWLGSNNEKTRAEWLRSGLPNGTLIKEVVKAEPGFAPMWFGAGSTRPQGIGSKITLVDCSQKIDISEGKNPDLILPFKNQIVCSFPALKGDSGALGVTQLTFKAFGMLMASTDKMSYFNSLQLVLDKMNVELIN